MNKYAFWNNKGGTGKTTLCFQLLCQYAIDHPDKRVLVVDVLENNDGALRSVIKIAKKCNK